MKLGRVVLFGLAIFALAACVALLGAIHCAAWDAAATFATLLVGFIAAYAVVWQGYLIKQ